MAAGQRKHRLFGLTLESDFPFATRLEPGEGLADLVFRVSTEPPSEPPSGAPAYESPLLDEAGDSLSRLYRADSAEVLRFGEDLDFYLSSGRIDCHLRRPSARELIEIRLLGAVLAYWLEASGILALHASAVVADGRAVAFLASHRGGKTGLAAAMMSGGAALLTDDLLPVESARGTIVARPGYPQMRMWPDQLADRIEGWERLDRVHPRLDKRRLPVGSGGFGTFHGRAAPLAAVYLPRRRSDPAGGEVGFGDVSPRDALIELVRGSFSPYIVEAVGLQAGRLELLGRVVSRVPVRRLDYPGGRDATEAVRQAVLDDLAAVGS